ncbi:MAG TPA: DoxX family protein [Candidatus Dormibacteraeota bacterium]|nr:DoxX family protein [Candidatus Dormibacteraeota bacterium]
MNGLWIAAGLLSFIVLVAGVEKLVTPYQELRARRPWVEDFDPRFVRGLGLLEVLGAIGVVAPIVTGIAPSLSPLAAACLSVLMVGAIAVEARHHVPARRLLLPLVTLLLAVVVAVGLVVG